MGRQVLVAEVEPGVGAVGVQPLQRVKGLTGDAPAGFGVGQAGERVHHGVHVGRDVQTVKLLVVGGVDDDGEVGRRQDSGQAERELCAADATREREIFHGQSLLPEREERLNRM